MKSKQNKKGLLLIVTGLLLVAAALLITAFNLYEAQRAEQAARAVLQELPEQMLTTERTTAGAGDSTPDYLLNPNMDMPTIEVDGHDYIGVLTIPSLGLELPVMGEWSYPNLKIAPCRYSGSAYLDNMVIAAHNYTRQFGRLQILSDKELVKFTDVEGNIFSYEVVQVEILTPADVEEITDSGWDLTLFTCNLSGSSRIAVRCKRLHI